MQTLNQTENYSSRFPFPNVHNVLIDEAKRFVALLVNWQL